MRRIASTTFLCAAACATTLAGRARAEAPSETAPAPVADADDTPEHRAEKSYDAAIASYARGDKETALHLMTEAHALSPHPELIYDLAKLEQEMGRCRDALAHYREYLGVARPGHPRDLAKDSTTQLDAQCGSQRPSYFTPARIVGWSAVGAGVAAGVAAVAFGLAGQSAAHDVETTWNAKPPIDWARFDERSSDGRRDNAFATGFAIAAGTLVTGGALLLIFGARPHEGPATRMSFEVLPGGSVFTYAQRF